MDIDIFVQCEFLTLDYVDIMNQEYEDILNHEQFKDSFTVYSIISDHEMEEFVRKPTYEVEELVQHYQ